MRLFVCVSIAILMEYFHILPGGVVAILLILATIISFLQDLEEIHKS